ncbi:MAG: thiamine phosphate synthase [Dialister sp.]|nr:thiamine phosphate synthase [Dialister sp.]
MKSFDTSLYLVTDRSGMGDCEFESKIRSAVEGGCTMVQLREKNINSYLMYQRALSIKKITDEYHVPLIINDRLDIMLAVGADGVHLGRQDIPVKIARKLIGKDKIIGVSAHCIEEAEKAERDGADYLGVGAIFPTTTKKDIIITPVNVLREIKETVSVPVVAIGGINQNNINTLKGSHVDGVAVISAIMKSQDPKSSAVALKASVFLL